MNVQTKIFLRRKFQEHYWNNAVKAPKKIEQREFGIGNLEKKIASRHMSFKTGQELQNFLKRDVPFYISYSTAYYEFPENQMSEKNWLGADLVFDLDAEMSFLNKKILDDVKGQVRKLIKFLTDDFGFLEKDISINFSGGKGYHLHISNDSVLKLDGEERGQIVDYVAGKIDLTNFLRIDIDKNEVLGPKKGDAGWAGRIHQSLHDFIKNANEKDLKRIKGIGNKRVEVILKKRGEILNGLDDGRYDLIPGEIVGMRIYTRKSSADPNVKLSVIDDVKSPILQRIIEENAVKGVVPKDTDRSVTIDTSRLIRLPDTIHGGTGLSARTVGNLEGFDPLVDSIIFSDKKMKIKITKEIPEFDLNGEKFGPFGKGAGELPEYAAIYLMLKDAAEIVKN